MAEIGVLKFYIERTLREGLEDVRRDPDKIDEFLSVFQEQESESLSDDIVAEFRTWVQKKVQKIYHQFPFPGERALPCYVITEMEHKEIANQSFIGERITPVSYVEHRKVSDNSLIQKDRVEFFGSEWDCVFEIQTWTLNGILTPLLHSLSVYLLFSGKANLTLAGGNTVSFSETSSAIRDDAFPNVTFLQTLVLYIDQAFKWKKVTPAVPLKKYVVFNEPVSSTPEEEE